MRQRTFSKIDLAGLADWLAGWHTSGEDLRADNFDEVRFSSIVLPGQFRYAPAEYRETKLGMSQSTGTNPFHWLVGG